MRTIAIGLLALTFASGVAGAQTAGEQARILRDFEQSVVDYSQRPRSSDALPSAIHAAAPAPKIFTLPVAMVFRQLIARALAERDGVAVINGVSAFTHATVLQRFPSNQLHAFPRVLTDALPPLPASLEYRLIGHDLVVRDTESDIVAGVLRDAVGLTLTVNR